MSEPDLQRKNRDNGGASRPKGCRHRKAVYGSFKATYHPFVSKMWFQVVKDRLRHASCKQTDTRTPGLYHVHCEGLYGPILIVTRCHSFPANQIVWWLSAGTICHSSCFVMPVVLDRRRGAIVDQSLFWNTFIACSCTRFVIVRIS